MGEKSTGKTFKRTLEAVKAASVGGNSVIFIS
jgi:hypothetical protein